MLARSNGRCPSCGTATPATDYCKCIPEHRWLHLYSAAPVSLKIATFLLCCTIVVILGSVAADVVANIYGGRGVTGLIEDAYGTTCMVLVIVPMIWTVVRGRIPWISVVMFCVSALTLTICAKEKIEVCIIATTLLIPYLLPTARQWRMRCFNEKLAYATAVKSGADLSSLKVCEYPQNGFAINALIFLVSILIGFFAAGILRLVHRKF